MDLEFGPNGHIQVFEMKQTLDISHANLRIFENICVFVSQSSLVLNSFESSHGSTQISKIAEFPIRSLLEEDFTTSEQESQEIDTELCSNLIFNAFNFEGKHSLKIQKIFTFC